MLADARDLVAIIALEKRLGVLRERVAERIVAGATVSTQELADGEQAAVQSVKRDFYTSAIRQGIAPGQGPISDDQDHDVEEGALMRARQARVVRITKLVCARSAERITVALQQERPGLAIRCVNKNLARIELRRSACHVT